MSDITMIDDPEVRAAFSAETEERLGTLEQGLLKLERGELDAALLDQVFREAHTLKGGAMMLGLTDLSTIAHRFEDVMGEARGRSTLPTASVEGLYAGLDAMRDLVRQALTGQAASVDVPRVLRGLSGGAGEASGGPAKGPAAKPAPPATKEATARIESVRVDPARLDTLMNHAGELTVTRGRIARRLAELEEIVALVEDEKSGAETAEALIQQLRAGLREDSTRLDLISSGIEEGIRAIRLLPLSTVLAPFPRMARDLAKSAGKEVVVQIEGGETAVDKAVCEALKEPLLHMIRNAVDHGMEPPTERSRAGKPTTGTLLIRGHRTANDIIVEVRDDGRGIDPAKVKRKAVEKGICTPAQAEAMDDAQARELIFEPGFSTAAAITDVSGRGVGMDVVRKSVERLKGAIDVDSAVGAGTTIRIRLPVSLATARVLVIEAAGRLCAIPMEHVAGMRAVAPSDVFTIEGRPAIEIEGRPVLLARLGPILDPRRAAPPEDGRARPVVVLTQGDDAVALVVDALLDEHEAIVKPLGGLMRRLRLVSGAIILQTGALCMVLSAPDVIRGALERAQPTEAPSRGARDAPSAASAGAGRKQVVLVVEDSIMFRTQEKRILEAAGYDVVTAVDGREALVKFAERPVDAVVTDVEMPYVSGLELTATLRQDPRNRDLPIILLTTLGSEDDRRRGLHAGANAYLPKAAFDQQALVDAIRRFL